MGHILGVCDWDYWGCAIVFAGCLCALSGGAVVERISEFVHFVVFDRRYLCRRLSIFQNTTNSDPAQGRSAEKKTQIASIPSQVAHTDDASIDGGAKSHCAAQFLAGISNPHISQTSQPKSMRSAYCCVWRSDE